MKLKLNRLMDLHIIAMTVLLSSCVNSIPEDIPESGDIPIKCSTNILCNNTRATDTNFEKSDVIGLYVLIQPKRIDQERYINNVKLTCPGLSSLEPENTLYYPTGDDILCDFISYYPYQESGIADKNNSINISIETDQSTNDALSKSDFMVATNNDISPSKKAVPLIFRHKFCKVQIILTPLPGEDVNALLNNDPEILFSGFHSKASYNFSTEQFSSFAESGNITLHGTWEIKNGKLIGKQINLLPEPLMAESHRITLNVNGKNYNCTFPSDYSLESGVKSTLTLKYSSSEGLQASKTDYSIAQWEDGIDGEIESEETAKNIRISSLTFRQSSVYKIMSNGTQVAEICKEYLLSDGIDAQAIVAYPYIDGKADLNKGIVLNFPESPQIAVGGKVSWSADNVLTYTPGSISSISYVYFTKEHEITFATPPTALSVWSEEDILVDVRGEEKLTYPKVKIGTQYWLASNLQATKYTDGNNITNNGSKVTEVAGYHTSTNKNYKFYNAAAIGTGKLTPIEWKIPTQSEWNILSNYVKGDASRLKAGTWSTNNGSSSGTSYPVNNKAGFNGYPIGYFTEQDGKLILDGNKEITNFWISISENEVVKTSFFLYCKNNEIKSEAPIKNNALSVRCIRK